LIDADHVIAFAQAGILSRPKKIWQSMLRRGEGKIHNQRNYLHSVFALIVLSAIVLLINLPV